MNDWSNFCWRCGGKGYWQEQIDGPLNLRTVYCNCGAQPQDGAGNERVQLDVAAEAAREIFGPFSNEQQAAAWPAVQRAQEIISRHYAPLLEATERLRRMEENALAQVKALFDIELYYSKQGNVELARANDDKARFLIMYFPAIFEDAFTYRRSLGADAVLAAALGDAVKGKQ